MGLTQVNCFGVGLDGFCRPVPLEELVALLPVGDRLDVVFPVLLHQLLDSHVDLQSGESFQRVLWRRKGVGRFRPAIFRICSCIKTVRSDFGRLLNVTNFLSQKINQPMSHLVEGEEPGHHLEWIPQHSRAVATGQPLGRRAPSRPGDGFVPRWRRWGPLMTHLLPGCCFQSSFCFAPVGTTGCRTSGRRRVSRFVQRGPFSTCTP